MSKSSPLDKPLLDSARGVASSRPTQADRGLAQPQQARPTESQRPTEARRPGQTPRPDDRLGSPIADARRLPISRPVDLRRHPNRSVVPEFEMRGTAMCIDMHGALRDVNTPPNQFIILQISTRWPGNSWTTTRGPVYRIPIPYRRQRIDYRETHLVERMPPGLEGDRDQGAYDVILRHDPNLPTRQGHFEGVIRITEGRCSSGSRRPGVS